MQRFTANTVLQGRILLKEALSVDDQSGQQTWAVQDQQTGKALIGRFHADGRIEWFNDNRPPAVPLPPVGPTPPVAVPPPVTAPPPIMPATAPGRQGQPPARQTGPFLLVMLVLGVSTAGYFYRKPVLAYVQSFRSGATTPSDSLQQPGSPALAPEFLPGEGPERKVVTSENSLPDLSAIVIDKDLVTRSRNPLFSASPITAQQATRLLNMIPKIPTKKHPAIFADARLAFSQLRQSSDHQPYIDSIYKVCMGRGGQSVMAYQQNGDPVSRQYAINWYQTAYALKPDPVLAERIARLTNGLPKQRPKPVKKPAKNNSSLFMEDPEVNQ